MMISLILQAISQHQLSLHQNLQTGDELMAWTEIFSKENTK
jgi:hypothetical protein